MQIVHPLHTLFILPPPNVYAQLNSPDALSSPRIYTHGIANIGPLSIERIGVIGLYSRRKPPVCVRVCWIYPID